MNLVRLAGTFVVAYLIMQGPWLPFPIQQQIPTTDLFQVMKLLHISHGVGVIDQPLLEFRAPDPASNPYLVFSAVLAAGLDGLKKKTDPGEQVREDIFKMTKTERKERGIGFLPANLGEALDSLESDRKFLNPIFTNDVIDKIIELERRDQREISIRPHPHEFYLYFDV